MKHSLPWESVPPPIYPAQSSLKPRKKWVQTGGWILVVVLLLFGISTRSRNPLLAFVSRRGYAPFAWWRIAVGALGLVGLYYMP